MQMVKLAPILNACILFCIIGRQMSLAAVDINVPKGYFTDYERWHLFEGVVHVSSPLNIFPQVGLGVQTNHSWPLYVGLKAGASGPIITAGWFYAQADVYLNVNLFQVSNLHFYLGANIIWRNHALNASVQSDAPYGDPTHFYGFSTAALKQKNYAAHLGLWHKVFFIEFGWEFMDFKSLRVSGPKLEGKSDRC